jgi:hypothetical protein
MINAAASAILLANNGITIGYAGASHLLGLKTPTAVVLTFEDYLVREETRVAEGVPSPTEDYETYHRAMQVRAGVRVNGEPMPWAEIMRRIRADRRSRSKNRYETARRLRSSNLFHHQIEGVRNGRHSKIEKSRRGARARA